MDSNLLECGICLSVFVEPHILPGCGHTFCKRCIQQIPKTSVGTFAGPYAATDSTCPLCRQRFHSRQVVPNFALQHVVAEGHSGDGAGSAGAISARVGGHDALDVQRDHSNADVAAVYRECGVPPQLAQVLAEEDHSIALRVYILDNSGSMHAGDGKIQVDPSSSMSSQLFRPASRWEELKHMALEHASWNAKLGVPSEFVLLNSPSPTRPVDGRDMVRIDAKKGNTHDQITALRTLLDRTIPGSGTPLTERLHDLRQRLHQTAPELHEKDRKLMLILVTDGIPNGSQREFAGAIRLLAKEHPVHVVVRLCTNDDSVSEFYNDVDKELELSLDILDDLQGEAKNVYQLNPWLTYAPVLHTVREAGTLSKLLDFVDERSLTPMEVGLCAQLLLRAEGEAKYPWQPEALLEAAERDLASAPPVLCVRRGTTAPILNVGALRAAIMPGKYSLTGQVASAVGLGGVAEAWYEGRTLWDAFQHPKVSTSATAASGAAHRCALCTRTTDGTFPHCCRTCQRTGGKEHGPTCERRNGPAPVEAPGAREIISLGAVPAGCCFVCARATDGIFPHCCRTCERSGGISHGPECEKRHSAVGYPQARAGKGPGDGGGKVGKCGYTGLAAGARNASGLAETSSNQALNASFNGSL